MKTSPAHRTSGSTLTLVLVLLLVAAAGVIIWQQASLASLRNSNRQLSAGAQELEQLRTEAAEIPRLRQRAAEVERLRQDNQELNRLRSEVGQLRSQKEDLAKLQAEVARLRQAQAALQQEKAAAESELKAASQEAAAFMAQQQVLSTQCINQLKQVALAGVMWAQDHQQQLPGSPLLLQQELSNPALLVCPGDPNRQPVAAWEQLAPGGVSYLFRAPGEALTDQPRVFVECPFHGHIGATDGSVQAGGATTER